MWRWRVTSWWNNLLLLQVNNKTSCSFLLWQLWVKRDWRISVWWSCDPNFKRKKDAFRSQFECEWHIVEQCTCLADVKHEYLRVWNTQSCKTLCPLQAQRVITDGETLIFLPMPLFSPPTTTLPSQPFHHKKNLAPIQESRNEDILDSVFFAGGHSLSLCRLGFRSATSRPRFISDPRGRSVALNISLKNRSYRAFNSW